ncbi:malectin domain-containing carbohydrate-binding protein [Litchfieldella xinjiangensis]|uniref:malectin domain-containing carbohydrate-binding protein n=1 Tax=Litchfieldella xinjiangensis TaxID=1166948 RepID=UPI0005BE6164|nr:malectin domain-containing carbohydrate-binding protein [Halomonas xinjiangensis]
MVSNDFSKSSLDLNGKVSLTQPTALVWGPDGKLYVTEVSGSVKVLTVAFGDTNPGDADQASYFHVTEAQTLDLVKDIPNHDDDGSLASGTNRQVTGIDVVQQFDAEGQPVYIAGKPAVSVYVTSSDSRIGAGGNGSDIGLDTNSGVITRIDQTSDGWQAVDIVRGLARSEENHSLNGLEVIQTLDDTGALLSQRLIVANGGNTNSGAPSNNFAGQQETAYSAAILEVDLDQLAVMPLQTDAQSGRLFLYDIPTLDDPTRDGTPDANDPFGGNDGLNGGKIDPDGPVQIYSAGYRNAYDVEVSDDGRIWTYDNGANNSWGGRPIGEAGDNGKNTDYSQLLGYIATNLNNGDINPGDTINLESWSPKNYDQFHEVTRSDDLAGRDLSSGQGGASSYEWEDAETGELLTLVYGGHPNPTRASGGQSGLLFTPKDGVADAYLLLSNVDKEGPGSSDYAAVHAWLSSVETQYGSDAENELTGRLIAVTPGERYYVTDAGKAYLASAYPDAPESINGETVLGETGMPADFDQVVATLNPIEGNYLEGGYTDGALDSGKGSINGLTEYTSTVLDDPESGVKMSGSILAASLNQGTLIVMGRDENGVMQTVVGGSGQTLAANRTVIDVSGAPLGLASLGDDLSAFGGQNAFQGSIWTTVFKQNGPLIEILQPANGKVPLAGTVVVNDSDHDMDGLDHVHDPFEFSDTNGMALAVGERITLDFQPTGNPYPGTLLDTGLMGAALDGITPNRDARTADEGFSADQQREGLYDLGGNIIPGGNAPIFQIKNVAGGTMVGVDNTARDAMHVGIRPASDVDRLLISSQVKNWVPSVSGGLKAGQLTGITLGDGTQANFLRLVFGAVMVDGVLAAGFEVGYELGDSYTPVATVAAPELSQGDIDSLTLHLEVDLGDDFAVTAGYSAQGEQAVTGFDLGGFHLPSGVLQDVLTGKHAIQQGGISVPSGAAVGFVAETSPEDAASDQGLSAIDFYDLNIEARGNDIAATTGAAVGTMGTEGTDTLVYSGSDTQLSALHASVENFDGSQSVADFVATGNSGDNILIAGSGQNTFTGAGGKDSIRGTFDTIDGTVITDFLPDDELLVIDAALHASDVTYSQQDGRVKLTLNDPETNEQASIWLEGLLFANPNAGQLENFFNIETTPTGTRITFDSSQVVYRVNAGGETLAATDGGLEWQGDTSSNFAYLSGNTKDAYLSPATDEIHEVDLGQLSANVPWQLFATERYDGKSASPALEYAFPVLNGEMYSVTLFYSENWNGIFDYAGDRLFDVAVEGAVPDAFKSINPLSEAYAALGEDATEAEVLGLGLSRTYYLTAGDDTLNLVFQHVDQNPKVNGIEIRHLAFGEAPADEQAPVVTGIVVETPLDNDSPLQVIVSLSDDQGIDLESIAGNELVFTGLEPGSVSLVPGGTTSTEGGKVVTVTYSVSPPDNNNAWPDGTYKVGVAEGAFVDLAGNASRYYEAAFSLNDGTPDPETLFMLGFETAGDPLDEGGFDGVLGGISDSSVITHIEGGDLVVQTSNGDIYKNNSANDFIKYTDLSDASLNEMQVSTRFANPFPAALAAQGKAADVIPDYAQQGLLFGLGTQGKNEVVKLVFGGIGGNVVQIWSNPDGKNGIKTSYQLDDMLADSALGLEDVADIEMTLSIDKAAGTVTPWVTLYDESGAVIGGLRSEATPGFVTAKAENLPAAVLDNLLDSAVPTAVGVTSNDYGSFGSFEARWDYLNVTTPGDGSGQPPVEPTLLALGDAPTLVESGDSGVTSLLFPLTADSPIEGSLTVTYRIDGGSQQSQSVVFIDGQATLLIDVANDDIDTGTTSVTVELVSVESGDVAIDSQASTASGDIEEDDGIPSPEPDPETLFMLDFETAGDPLDEGGFDGVLGGISDSSVIARIEGGDLVVQTSNGDIYKNNSANDFIKYTDLSDASLNEVQVSTRFANPFPAALAAQGKAADVIPDYAQQGLLFGLGTQGKNEVVKLVFGGIGGNVVQIWSNPDGKNGIKTSYQLDDMLADSALGLEAVADIEMTLSIDKAVGTVTPWVTLYAKSGAVIGGLRSEATPGFVTAKAENLPAAVLDNLLDSAVPTAVGVTSNDYGSFGSFEARWDYLEVTGPGSDGSGEPTVIAIDDAPTLIESGDSGATRLLFPLTTDDDVNAEMAIEYSLDGGVTTAFQTVAFVDGHASLSIDIVNDESYDGVDIVTVELIDALDNAYVIDGQAYRALGTVLEDDDPEPMTASEVFAQAAIEIPDSYAAGHIGSVLVTVTPGGGVQKSNFGVNSFEVTNIGDKKIAAVFFDVRSALYGDSVFDPDGKGGDTAYKDWSLDTAGNTGAISPSQYEHYFLRGADPDPTNAANNGGFHGALLKFSATTDGGFNPGEKVGFSGDMDPNSIAGMQKEGTYGVDTNSQPQWDVGGISGAELIGSTVHVQFTDGSIASGQLMGDTSQSGARALVSEGMRDAEVSLEVNSLLPGEDGTYQDSAPSVEVFGEAGAWVRVIMTKGHQPVVGEQVGVGDIVDWRLSGEAFPVNNAAEFQFVDIQLDVNGYADVTERFAYDTFLNGTVAFEGSDRLPLGFVAAVMDSSGQGAMAVGPVSSPIYLQHDDSVATALHDDSVTILGVSPYVGDDIEIA